MTEFEIFKKALERTGAKLNITSWDFSDHTEDLIEDLTNHVDFWFTDKQLTDIEQKGNGNGNYNRSCTFTSCLCSVPRRA